MSIPMYVRDSRNQKGKCAKKDFGDFRLQVSVLRKPSLRQDCTNGGVSSKYEDVLLVGPVRAELLLAEGPQPENILVLQNPNLHGTSFIAVPLNQPKDTCGPMMGGNFIHACDSRFSELNGGDPIAVHDRFETKAQYALNSMD